MDESLPPVGEFAAAFVDFMAAMHEAAERGEDPLLTRIREHLGVEPAELPITAAGFAVAERPNLQLALDEVLPDSERETIGLPNPHMHRIGGGFAELFMHSRRGLFGAVPVEYADVEVGDGRIARCIASALLLGSFESVPTALVVTSGQAPPMGQIEVRLEAIAPDDDAAPRLFAAIREAMRKHNVFRGKIISLSVTGAVTFPAIPEISREAVVLPAGTLERLEHHAIAVAEHADKLRAAGRHLKRGVLMHGPPGTGKTLTVNYLLSATRGRTSVVLTGQALGMIEQAFGIARDLAPATVVLEDVDLVAQERTTPFGHGALFELLNQLEGLSEDADLLVLLTTNRPDLIEPALAARPGRVDLALELPLPDERSRERLLRLYAKEIELPPETVKELVERTKGTTGALIKELMRQATLRATVSGTAPSAGDVMSILDELLEERAALTRRLLGQPPDGDQPALPPPEGMARAVGAAGILPRPPGIHFGRPPDL